MVVVEDVDVVFVVEVDVVVIVVIEDVDVVFVVKVDVVVIVVVVIDMDVIVVSDVNVVMVALDTVIKGTITAVMIVPTIPSVANRHRHKHVNEHGRQIRLK